MIGEKKETSWFSKQTVCGSYWKRGDLAVWWNDDLKLDFVLTSRNKIHARAASDVEEVPQFISLVYGPPKEEERRHVWDRMKRIADLIQGSWICVRDFNDILRQEEKLGGNPKAIRKIMRFQLMLNDCSFMDLEFKGSTYTWANGREGSAHIKEM